VLNIKVLGANAMDLEIRLVDILGATVAPSKGYNPPRVSVQHLSPGLYFLVAKSETFQVTRKVIIK